MQNIEYSDKVGETSREPDQMETALETPMRWENREDGCIYGRRKAVESKGGKALYVLYCEGVRSGFCMGHYKRWYSAQAERERT